ncbi:hypothetical protein [Roseobacter ponti]|uniref:Uncharacterized protein n=1 Tax=Roseobacter ponti TaxID=1891787 RepID=A0A858SZG0_9RHOB|nr:hypothetical protein [Roseobacter ponti]QJF52881.1 hypothetical protein G3256_17735 [Roseobacter ponti]
MNDALSILHRMPGLSKIRAPGATLSTDLNGPLVMEAETLARLKTGSEPAREDLQAVIFALDLLAAGAPDNDLISYDADIQRVAGKLRERYSRRFKTSAYADPVTPA